MKFTILSINDDRIKYKQSILKNVRFPYESVVCFDATKQDPLEEIEKNGWVLHREPDWTPKAGELGVWISTIRSWQKCIELDEPLIVFEDDAVVEENFMRDLEALMVDLPEDYGYLSLWVPPNQYQDYTYKVTYDNRGMPTVEGRVRVARDSPFYIGKSNIAKVYQGYGNVATLYSPDGARCLIKHLEKHGMYAPVDCFIHMAAHAQAVRGYAHMPDKGLVGYDWSQETTVHNTGRV